MVEGRSGTELKADGNKGLSQSHKQLLVSLSYLALIPLIFAVSHALGFRAAWEGEVLPSAIQALEDGQYEKAASILEPFLEFGDCGIYYEQAQAELDSRNSDYERALELMYLGEFRESYNILSQYKDETASILAEYCKLRIAEGGAE